MRFLLLILMACCLGVAARRIRLMLRCGRVAPAKRLYGTCAWTLGGVILGAQVVQEAVLLFSGQLTWANGLPLHLCSSMGLIALPMLLSRRPVLCHLSLYLGVPGALMALMVPAVLETPWPRVTELAFHTMHCGVTLAPVLPLSMGWRPRPVGTVWAGGYLTLLALVALGVNALTGGNYLFLRWVPVAGLSTLGMGCIAAGVLTAEALIVWLVEKRAAW